MIAETEFVHNSETLPVIYCAFSFLNFKIHLIRDSLHTYIKAEGGDYIFQFSLCLDFFFLKSGKQKMLCEKYFHEPETTHVNDYNIVEKQKLSRTICNMDAFI